MVKKVSNFLKNLFSKRNRFVGRFDGVVPAFVLDGVTYYTFNDMMELPHQRAFEALTEYAAFESRITPTELRAFFELTDNFIEGKASKKEYIQMFFAIQKKMEYAFDPLSAYRLAACVYFTDKEDPYRVSEKEKSIKTRAFARHGKDFFLRTSGGNYGLLPKNFVEDTALCLLNQTEERLREYQIYLQTLTGFETDYLQKEIALLQDLISDLRN